MDAPTVDTATTSTTNITGIARTLMISGLLEKETAAEIVEKCAEREKRVIGYIVENEILESSQIAEVVSRDFGVPLLDITKVEKDANLIKLVQEDLIKRLYILPVFKRGKRLFVAISDPTNTEALDDVRFATGMLVEPVVVEEEKLVKTIKKLFNIDDDVGLDDDVAEFEIDEDGEDGIVDEDSDVDDAPVVRFVNKCLLDAIKKGGSDLHFEPYEKHYRVRFRVDGILQEVTRPPMSLSAKIAARIKVMSRLDVSERRVPQDGRIKLKISKRKSIDFRVSTCPTLYGEKICMRILDSDVSSLQIDQLGYEDHQKELFLTNLHKPYGMFLVTGPTGSGKTVSLYSGINILNKNDINISTAEDPVEINLSGVNQVQVDERTGMNFEKALKAFLRQDPDIILVGEIRDLSTASIAVKAAQTGHMVMSTLHTNDCPQTLTRLQDMGIQAFAVATTINLITAQRLLRRLNPENTVPLELPEESLRKEGFSEEMIAKGIKLFEPGEDTDDNPAYKGRAGVYQVMPISDDMKRLIIENANAVQLADQAKSEGIWDIRESGLMKAAAGISSLTEVNRVTTE